MEIFCSLCPLREVFWENVTTEKTEQSGPKFRRKSWRVFFVVATGVFLSTMDSSMVNIALPAIMDHFHSSLRVTEWVMMAYLLTITVTLLIWGYVGDRVGRRRMYAAGLLLFGGGALACSQVDGLGLLIGCRIIQASGAAMMMATGPAVIRENFPQDSLGQAFGMIGIAVSLGLMTGPSAGGFLLHAASWRSVFLVPAPVALLAAAGALLFIPPSRRYGLGARFDVLGSLTWAAGLCLLFLAVSYASSPSWSVMLLVMGLVAACACFVVFVRTEAVVPAPLLSLSLVRGRFFWTAILCAALSFMMLFAVTILMPFYLDRVRQMPSYQIGLVMMAIPLAAMLVAPVAGFLSDRIGSRLLTTAGLALGSLGLFLLARLGADSGIAGVAARLSLVGAGQAMFLSPNSSSVLRRVKGADAAVSAALLATARNLGMLAGIALSGLVFSLFFSSLTGGLDLGDFTGADRLAFVVALRRTFLLAGLTGLLGAGISWARGKDHLNRTVRPDGR